jgi:uncharacterized damage-inducible protein DinB
MFLKPALDGGLFIAGFGRMSAGGRVDVIHCPHAYEEALMKGWLCAVVLLTCSMAFAQKEDPIQGLFTGYDGELHHVTKQLVELAEAIPADKYAWRPAPGVRSTGEVFMHIATASYYLLDAAGQKSSKDVDSIDVKKVATDKEAVIKWLKGALDQVRQDHVSATPADMQRKVTLMKHDGTVEGVYLRILVHANEHMGQLIAYARMNGVVPPWSK